MIICKSVGDNQAEQILEIPDWTFKELIKSNDCEIAIVVEVKEGKNYKKGFNLLHAYFDDIPEEEKPKVHAKLEELGI